VRGHVLDEQAVVREQVGGELHPLPQQILVGAQAIEPPEQTAGVGG
jgi:hypothetical protein